MSKKAPDKPAMKKKVPGRSGSPEVPQANDPKPQSERQSPSNNGSPETTADHPHIEESIRRYAMPLAALVQDPANVRKHNDRNLEAIKGSLTRFGQQKPIIITGDNVVIAGNGTLVAARALGWTHIAAIKTSAICGSRSSGSCGWSAARGINGGSR